MNGISALIKETQRAPWPRPPHKDTARSLGPRRGPSPDQVGTLISDF